MDSVRGRTICRESDKGYGLLEPVVILSAAAPEKYRMPLRSMAKRLAANNGVISPYSSLSSIYAVDQLYRILCDSQTPMQEDKLFYKQFPAMDRFVCFMNGSLFGAAMYSSRIRNYESINDENISGWHTSSGMTYLYNDDLTQYDNGFWPTVDKHRLPGTTVVKGSKADNGLYGQAFAGGTALNGRWGVSAMEYLSPDADGKAHGLRANKAWFCFDNEIVCLGSGIASALAEDDAETIFECRRLEGGNVLTVDGTAYGSEQDLDVVRSPQWAHLTGNPARTLIEKHSTDIGYYYPQKDEIQFQLQNLTGGWDSMRKISSAQLTRRYAVISADHGAAPKDDSYAYAILPGMTAEETRVYSQAPDITVVENTSVVQMVRENTLHVTGAVFYAGGSAPGLYASAPCTVMLEETGDQLCLAAADPTQELDFLELRLDRTGLWTIQADPGMYAETDAGGTVIRIDTKNARGKTFTIRLSSQAPEAVPSVPEGFSLKGLTPISVCLTWERKPDAEYYLIYARNPEGPYEPLRLTEKAGEYVHKDLEPNTVYYYRLAAGNDRGISAYSRPLVVTLPDKPDSFPVFSEIDEDFENFVPGPVLYQNSYKNAAALPEGTEYIRITIPTSITQSSTYKNWSARLEKVTLAGGEEAPKPTPDETKLVFDYAYSDPNNAEESKKAFEGIVEASNNIKRDTGAVKQANGTTVNYGSLMRSADGATNDQDANHVQAYVVYKIPNIEGFTADFMVNKAITDDAKFMISADGKEWQEVPVTAAERNNTYGTDYLKASYTNTEAITGGMNYLKVQFHTPIYQNKKFKSWSTQLEKLTVQVPKGTVLPQQTEGREFTYTLTDGEGAVIHELVPGAKTNAKVTLQNNDCTPLTVSVITQHNDGVIKIQPVTITPKASAEVSAELIPETAQDTGKIYIWESIGSMRPVTEAKSIQDM